MNYYLLSHTKALIQWLSKIDKSLTDKSHTDGKYSHFFFFYLKHSNLKDHQSKLVEHKFNKRTVMKENRMVEFNNKY